MEIFAFIGVLAIIGFISWLIVWAVERSEARFEASLEEGWRIDKIERRLARLEEQAEKKPTRAAAKK